jgi:hypothetical protein
MTAKVWPKSEGTSAEVHALRSMVMDRDLEIARLKERLHWLIIELKSAMKN